MALTTFSHLVEEGPQRSTEDGAGSGYAHAIATYLGFGVSRLSDICNSLCRWEFSKTQMRNLFGRQAIPMVWGLAEPNVFADAAGHYRVRQPVESP
jgi:putative DNA methylase